MYSKSFLVLFLLQLLASSACIATAGAAESIRLSPVAAHCNNKSLTMEAVADMEHSGLSHSVCSHCDIPDMSLSASALTITDMVAVLLAVIDFPEMPPLLLSDTLDLADQGAPPHSFSLLYQTTLRILI
ncbi:MAG: hypothetical protein Q9M20_01090 [Mariprofundaceae bacterium]|nr:hypothetical protein [Mariprofundaceae bacterium]